MFGINTNDYESPRLVIIPPALDFLSVRILFNPNVFAPLAADLTQEGIEVGCPLLTTRPEFHPFVEDRYPWMVDAGGVALAAAVAGGASGIFASRS